MDIARSTVKVFFSNFTSGVLGFLAITYFARELGSSTLGIFFLFEALLGILAIVADIGLRGAVEKRISGGDRPDQILTTSILLKLILVGVVSAAILVFGGQVNRYVGHAVAGLLVVGLVLQEYSDLFVKVLIGEQRVGETASLDLVRQLSWVLIGSGLVYLGFGVEALITALLVGYVLRLVWALAKVSTTFGYPSLGTAHSLFDYGRYYVISQAGGRVWNWMDVAILGLFVAKSPIGAYEVAWRVSLIVLLFSQALGRAVFPEVSRLAARRDFESVEELLPDVLSASVAFAIPALFGTLVVAEELLRFLFGAEYTVAWFVLVVFMTEMVFQSGHRILARVIEGINRPNLAARATVMTLGLNLVLNFSLIPFFGITGAAAATLFSFLFNTIIHAHYLSRHITIRVPYRDIGGYLGASLMMLVALWLVERAYPIVSLPVLIAHIILGVTVYSVMITIDPHLRSRMVILTRNIRAE